MVKPWPSLSAPEAYPVSLPRKTLRYLHFMYHQAIQWLSLKQLDKNKLPEIYPKSPPKPNLESTASIHWGDGALASWGWWTSTFQNWILSHPSQHREWVMTIPMQETVIGPRWGAQIWRYPCLLPLNYKISSSKPKRDAKPPTVRERQTCHWPADQVQYLNNINI